jgi:hypothetical protein
MLAVTYRLPFIAIAHNHTLLFQNRSFFMPLDPEDPACLTGIFDGLEDRLSGVEPRDFDEITETCRWSNLTPPLCQKLKECP